MTVRIGFAGVGAMGQCAHLRNYASIPGCRVVALAERHASKGRQVAARYGVPRVYGDIAEMLAEEELDGIVASQPFNRHGRVLPALLEAGVPIFTEKPLAASVPVGERLVEQVAAGGAWHMVGYHKRSDPATMLAKEILAAWNNTRELGRMTYVRILMPAGDWIASGFTDLITGDPEDAPTTPLEFDPRDPDMDDEDWEAYTAFVNYYIHQVNLIRHLLGEDYRATYADPSGILFVGHSDSGICCTLEMTPYQTSIDWQETALVCFERGWLKLELPAPLALNRPGRITLFRDPEGGRPETLTPQLPWVHAMRQQAMNFVAAIRGERPPPCEAAEALEDLKIAREYIRMLREARS